MDWSNERYVRVYTRDTVTWKLLDWRGKATLALLFRKVDRAGVLDVGHDGVLGLAALLELPLEVVEPGIAQLTASRGGVPTVVDTGTAYVIPNFLEAQEAPSSDAHRKRESRSRRRDVALATSRNLLLPAGIESDGHETGHDRHAESQEVTPIRSVPSRSDPEISLPRDPSVPAPEPALVPVMPQPPPASRDIAMTQPADAALRKRQILRVAIWSELAAARASVATELKLPAGDQALMAFDPGENALASRLLAARNDAELELIASQARKAIAVIAAEARASRSVEWLTGAVFESDRSWRRAIGKSLDEAKRPRSAKGEPVPAPRRPDPPRKPDPAPEELDATQAVHAEFMARFYGTLADGARAPPASAAPTITDEERKPGKAHTT